MTAADRPQPPGLVLVLDAVQAVDKPTPGKNRMHLDLHVPDMQAEARRLVELGATRLGEGRAG